MNLALCVLLLRLTTTSLAAPSITFQGVPTLYMLSGFDRQAQYLGDGVDASVKLHDVYEEDGDASHRGYFLLF